MREKSTCVEETPRKAVAIPPLSQFCLVTKMIFAVRISRSYLFEMVTKRNQFCHIRVSRIGDLL